MADRASKVLSFEDFVIGRKGNPVELNKVRVTRFIFLR